jgi:hypothetical protein
MTRHPLQSSSNLKPHFIHSPRNPRWPLPRVVLHQRSLLPGMFKHLNSLSDRARREQERARMARMRSGQELSDYDDNTHSYIFFQVVILGSGLMHWSPTNYPTTTASLPCTTAPLLLRVSWTELPSTSPLPTTTPCISTTSNPASGVHDVADRCGACGMGSTAMRTFCHGLYNNVYVWCVLSVAKNSTF